MIYRFILSVLAGLFISTFAYSQTQTEQDIMVGYTVGARDLNGGTSQIISRIRQGIINTNLAIERSGAGAKVVERMIGEFSLAEKGRTSGGFLAEWRRKRGGEAFGRSQAFWENELGIDFAMIIGDIRSGANGEAENTGTYSMIRATRITNPTFAHELGHNYGCTHNGGRFNFEVPGAGSRSTLLESRGRGFGNVINNYSNPNVSIDANGTLYTSNPPASAAPTGTSNNNNAGRINERMAGRQNVRPRNTNPSPSDPGLIALDSSTNQYNFDLGTENSPVLTNWTRISPVTGGDISWSTSVSAIDRGTQQGVNAINQDFVTHNAPATLSVKVLNGRWNVSVNMADTAQARDNMRLDAETGQVVLDDIDRAAGSPSTISFSVTVTDGSFDLTISDNDPGGSWTLARLSLTRVTDMNLNVDGDLLADVFEYQFFGNLTTSAGAAGDDQDGDGLSDLAEQNAGSDPTVSDTDEDGLPDNSEVTLFSSDPNAIDSDGDGYLDVDEVFQRSDPASGASIPDIDGLVAYYPLDEGSGGTANDVAPANGVQNAQQEPGNIAWTDTQQLIGSSAFFAQGTSSIKASSALPTGTEALTLSVWANPALDPNAITFRGIFVARGQDNSQNWGINISGTQADFRFGGQGMQASGVTFNEAGGWYHLVMTWETDGSTGTARIYVNGSLIQTRTTGIPALFTSPTDGFFIGTDSSSANRVFNGQIDDVAVFSRRLTDAEISNINTQGRTGRSIISALEPATIDPSVDDDNDMLSDAWEISFFGSIGVTDGLPNEDQDNDQLTDREEFTNGTDPTRPDTDEDGLSDFAELTTHGTSPLDADSDDDGFTDGEEVGQRSDPVSATGLPLISGLVAYYPLDEGSGTVAADIAPFHSTQNAQQEVGTVGWTTSAQLIGSGALDLDGNSALLAPDALVADGVGEAGVEEFTFSIWINPDTEGLFKGVFSGREGAGNWGINVEGREIDFRYAVSGGASTGFNTADDTILTSGGWYHIAMSWKSTGTGSEARMYLNGVNVITRTNVARSDYAMPTLGFFLGGDGTRSGRFFDGQIDDLAVFSRALSLAEVERIYAEGQEGRSVISALLPPPLQMTALENFRFIADAQDQDVEFSFSTQKNAFYDVFTSTNLVDWIRIEEQVLGTGGDVEIIDPDGGNDPRRFYRVQQR